MRISDLIPEKNSLITRNYWWKRAQLGLPTPEFEPVPSFANMRQPPGGNEFRIRADGEVVSHDLGTGCWSNQFNRLHVYPGDTIVVPEKAYKPYALRGVLGYSQMFSQFAHGAPAISVIQ